MIRGRVLILLVSLLLCPAGRAQDWRLYSSDNFTLYSDSPENDTQALLRNFEIFRRVALPFLGLEDEPENRRLLIVLYDDAREFTRSTSASNPGIFYNSLSGPRMLLRRSVDRGDVPPRDVLFHEYVHYLLHERSTSNYPRWYSEGLATLMESVEITDKEIRVGTFPVEFARSISRGLAARVGDVIRLDARGDSGFYLTAWRMSHYFFLGDPERAQQTRDYLRRYDAGEDPVEAFTASYGISTKDMDREISRYFRRRGTRVLVSPRIEYTGKIFTRALAPEEALLLRADVAIELGRYAVAHRYFEEAEEIEDESAYRASLWSRRAVAYIHERRVSEGDQLIARLLEQPVEDARVLGDIAHFAFDKFVEIRAGRSEGSEDAELDRAVEYGLRAVEADPENVEAHYYLGLSYEARGELQAAVDALLNGYDVDSSSASLNVAVARILVKGRQPELASYLLSRLYSNTRSEERRASLREIIDDLEDGEVDIKKYPGLLPAWRRGL